MVNLEWYRTFKAVYETGSLTAASKILFISQPNVSQHISALEAHIGKSLFERKHRVVPTDYAKIIYTHIVEPIDKLEEVESIFKKMCLTKSKPTINIGSSIEYLHFLATKNLKDFQGIVITHAGEAKELFDKLITGDLDFILCSQFDESLKLSYLPILNEVLKIVGSNDIDVSYFEAMILKSDLVEAERWLLTQNWFSYGSDLEDIRRFWITNFKKKPVLVPQVIISDRHSILTGIVKGNALTVASDFTAETFIKEKKIKDVWNGFSVTSNTLYLVYDPLKIPSAIVDMVKELFEI